VRLHARRAAGSVASTLGEDRGNLPASFAGFVGRESQLDELAGLLQSNRLVTLAGAPGVGKTRLALQLAHRASRRYTDGAWFVDLTRVFEPPFVAQATARSLNVRDDDGTPLEALVHALRDRRLLLVLDNCEHLLDACASLAASLLTGCPGLQVLATSRQPLGLTGEVAWRVPSLSVPVSSDGAPGAATWARAPSAARAANERLRALLASEAGRLFLERARGARPTFNPTESDAAAVGEICRRVDGIPLAIELAAARVAHLEPGQIAARLDDRFRLLATWRASDMQRHGTLRALVEWSHDLLSDAERVVFRRLSVFAGGWTLEAAEAVCEAGVHWTGVRGDDVLDVLGQLVDKSLVQLDEQSGTLRYRLQETLRLYALERLDESGEAPEIRRRHAEYCLAVVEDAEPELFGRDLQRHLDRLEREHDNVRVALRWSSETGDPEVGLRLAGALWRFWQVRGYVREGRDWLERLLGMAQPTERTAGRARALNAIGFLAFLQGDYDTAQPLLEECLATRRALDEPSGLVESLANLGVLLRCSGASAEARALFEEALALARLLGDRAWEGRTLNKLARLVFYFEGDPAKARALCEEGLARVRQAGNTWDVAIALGDLADVNHALGDDVAARRHYVESLALWQELGEERGIAQALEGFATLIGTRSQPERVVHMLGAADAIRERITEPSSTARRAGLERLLAAARATLGTTYASAWERGRASPPEHAITEALAGSLPAADVSAVPSADGSRPAMNRLTAREREVVALIARGLSNRQIADALVVSSRTVEWHVSNVLGRLALESRAQLALWARENGIPPAD